jgi:hypothetical protein
VTNKWRAGASIDQMTVWRDGGRRGAWKDFVSGEKGDAIDLVAYGLTGIVTADSRMTALDWLEDRFGLQRHAGGSESASSRRRRGRARRSWRPTTSGSRRRSRREAQKFFFSAASPDPRHAGRDLSQSPRHRARARAAPFHGAALPARLRLLDGRAARRRGQQARPRPGVSGDDRRHGDRRRHAGACHYTFLEPDGSSKLKTGDRGYVDATAASPIRPS